jgi:pimeloyl-[acyl-carrier protein] methyl ester esterase
MRREFPYSLHGQFQAMKLVLLPGLDGSGRLFAPLVNELRDVSTSIITYPNDANAGYVELATHAHKLLPQEPFVLLGESFSGPIAISLAAQQCSNLRGLILSTTFARNPRTALAHLRGLAPMMLRMPMPDKLAAHLLYGYNARQHYERALCEALRGLSQSMIRRRLLSVLDVDVSQALRQINVPILSFVATRDALVPASASKHLRETKPTIREVQLDAPHGLLQIASGAAANEIRRFLASIGDA